MSTLAARAARGSLWLGLVNLASKGSQIAVTVVLASFLTQSQLGLVTVAVSLVSIAQVVQAMGVYDVIARTERDEAAMAGTVAVLSVGIGVVLAAIGILGSRQIEVLLGAPGAAPLIAITALSLPFSAFGGVQMALMHRTLDFRRRLLPDAGSAIVGSAVTITLAVLGAGPYSLAIGLLCTAVLQPVFGHVVGTKVRPRWDEHCAGEAVRWIRVVGPAAIIANVLINIDYPIISRTLGPDAVGIYSLAYRIAWVPYIMIAVVLGAVAFPVYTTMVRDRNIAQLPEAVGRFTHATLLVVGGMYVITALMADHIVLLGDQWAPVTNVLIVLCGYGLGISMLCTWYEPIRAAGKIRRYLALEVTHLILLIALLATLTRFGVVAAACAPLAAAWAIVPLAWIVMSQAGVRPPVRAVARGVIGLAAPALACAALDLVLRRTGILGPADSLPGTLAEGVLLVSCFLAIAAVANRPMLAQLRQLWKVSNA